MGERLNGIQEVGSSILPGSTNHPKTQVIFLMCLRYGGHLACALPMTRRLSGRAWGLFCQIARNFRNSGAGDGFFRCFAATEPGS